MSPWSVVYNVEDSAAPWPSLRRLKQGCGLARRTKPTGSGPSTNKDSTYLTLASISHGSMARGDWPPMEERDGRRGFNSAADRSSVEVEESAGSQQPCSGETRRGPSPLVTVTSSCEVGGGDER
ncbi:unnamed protein product [Fusarium venenatum]|uniref:Uncharacterized protein n=1 Tax=Fusarium venenatum TaxID=56646 RepID=A0A2L2SX25_9HYPO|nr:uncharacterized protein FVRRES_05615 [Fusarium venenatum]CEI61179.1 unnamed protein product [Fusarium venenatum]